LQTTELRPAAVRDQHQIRSLLLVLFCTFLNAASQVFIKKGTASLGAHPSMLETAIGIFTRPMLFSGYALLGVSTVLLILALRRGELSLLYPVLTLGYVWVTILSVVIFQDSMNIFKIGGVAVIISGVAVLGRASRE
jgi:multidrug transporter EmrE-like cation transporter